MSSAGASLKSVRRPLDKESSSLGAGPVCRHPCLLTQKRVAQTLDKRPMSRTSKSKPRASLKVQRLYHSIARDLAIPNLASVANLIGGDLSLISFPIAKEWRRYWSSLIFTIQRRFPAKRIKLWISGGKISKDDFVLYFFLEYMDPYGGRDKQTKKIRRRILHIGMFGGFGPQRIDHIWDTYSVDRLSKAKTPSCIYPIIPPGGV